MAACILESGLPCLDHPPGGYCSTCHGFSPRSSHIQGRNGEWIIVEDTDTNMELVMWFIITLLP